MRRGVPQWIGFACFLVGVLQASAGLSFKQQGDAFQGHREPKARDIHIFLQIKHSGDVTSMVMTPDGHYLVTGGNDETVKVWDFETGALAHTLKAHESAITHLLLSPDGRYFLSVDLYDRITFWDVKTWRRIRSIEGYNIDGDTVVWSPNGHYLIFGTKDNRVKVLDVQTMNTIMSFTGHDRSIRAIAVSSDGRYVISGGDDKRIIVWDFKRRGHVYILKGHKDAITEIIISPDGHYIVSGSKDHTVKVWSLETGKLVKTLKGGKEIITALKMTPKGRYIITKSNNNIIKVWDLLTGKTLHRIYGIKDPMVLSPDRQYLAGISLHETLQVREIETNQLVREIKAHDIRSMAFSPNGNYILTGDHDGFIKVWEFQTGRLVQEFGGLEERLTKPSIMKITTLKSQELEFVPIIFHSYCDAECEYYVGILNSRHGDMTIESYIELLCKNSEECKTYLTMTLGDPDVKVLDLNPLVLTIFNKKIIVKWPGSDIKLINNHLGLKILSACLTPDYQYLITGNQDGSITFWNIKSGTVARVVMAHMGPVLSLSISDDGKYLVSGSQDTTLKVWDVEEGKVLRTFDGHQDAVTVVAFSTDGQYIISGSRDKTVKVWDSTTGKLLQTFAGHDDTVTAVMIFLPVHIILSGSQNGMLRWWSLDDGREIARTYLFNKKDWLTVTSDGYFMASSEGSKYVNLTVDGKTFRYIKVRDRYGFLNNEEKVASHIQIEMILGLFKSLMKNPE